MTETRKATLPSGDYVTCHLFFADARGAPMAVVEYDNGKVEAVPATWVNFVTRRDYWIAEEEPREVEK
jgi:hypothetical protein